MNIPVSKTRDWSVKYSPYVDTLHVYKNTFSTIPKSELKDKDYGDFYIVCRTKDSQIILFEMKSASNVFGEIDKMDKEHIIRKVKRYIESHESSK